MMRRNTAMNGKKLLKRITLLCLCLALLAGSACAEGIRLGTMARETLKYICKMPDGRLLLAVRETGRRSGASLVCLNPDRTVSWEYRDPLQGVYCVFTHAAVLEDGTVAAVRYAELGDGAKRNTAVFLTPEGKATGKETELPEYGAQTYAAEPSYLMELTMEASLCTTTLRDWDGNVIARYDGLAMCGGYGAKVMNDDSVVTYGTADGRGKIMKMDGLTDKVLWETILDLQWEDTESVELTDAVKTEDGGYAVCLREGKPAEDDGDYEWRKALVKVDADGRVLWVNKEDLNAADRYMNITSWNGKILLRSVPETEREHAIDAPETFVWFDENGKKLGTTELTMTLDAFPSLREQLVPQDSSKPRIPVADYQELIPMADGLWAMVSCAVAEKDEFGFLDYPTGNEELVLIKVPEL